MVDLGNLQLGISIGGMDAIDRLERQMVALENRFGPPMVLDISTSSAQRSLDEYIRVTGTAISSNRALSESEMQLARDLQAAAASRQSIVALERIAATERVQIARNAAAQETAIERERIRQTEQNARQREQIEARAAQTIYQEQQRAARQQASGGGGGGYMSARGAIGQAFGGGVTGFAIGSAAVAGGSLLTSGLVAATKASIDLNSQLQSSQLAFATFLGSTEAADAHIRDLAAFAARTPFQFPDLLEASKRLQSMGFAARDVIPDLTAIGNAVAAMGTGKEGIDRITLALGQMQQKGKVSGEELRQLAEAGVNATLYISQALGKTQAETLALSQRGEISGTTGVSAIITGLAADPKFAGLMDKQSRSFAGSMSNIQDSAQMAIATGLKPLFVELNNTATALAAFTASDSFTKGAADFATALHDDIDALKELGSVGKGIGDPLLPLVTGAINMLPPLRELKGLSEFLTGNKGGRAQAQAGAAGLSDMDVAMQRVIANQKLLDLQANPPGDWHGIKNPKEVIDYGRDIQQQKEIVAEYDKILAARQQQQYEAGRFIGPPLPPEVSEKAALAEIAKQFNIATSAAEEYRAKLLDVGHAQAQGAGSEDISRAILGITGTGDQATQSQVAIAKQHITELAQAWQQAGSVIGSVDLSKGGIAGLAAQSEGLRKAREELSRLGQNNASLNMLSGIASTFAELTKTEDAATAAMRSFDLTLDVTKRYMGDISGLKTEFVAALSAAEERRAAGIADQSDLDVINAAPGALAKLNDQYGKLQQVGNRNLLGKIDNLPDYANLAKYVQQIIDGFPGGARQIMFDVQSNAKIAAKEIDDIVNGKHEATIDVNLAIAAGNAVKLPAWVMTALGLAAGGGVPGGSGGIVPPGGGGNPAAANPVGWNQFQPLSMPQFSSIVAEGAGGRQSPWQDDPNMYAAVLAAAQRYGVDPRVLLAWTKDESGNGTTSSAALNAINNFGGIQFAGQPGATDAGFAEPGHSRNFAAFNTPEDFFNALAANLSTDNYRNLYDKGDLIGVSKQYAESPGTRVQDYADYATRYPAGGQGGVGFDDPRFGGALPAAANGLGSQIVNEALKSINQKKLVNYCEQFVEETVQAITGRRGATGQKEYDANTALAHAQSMGLETNTPQPGDLVYYGDADKGHVAIYMGDGKQISTADAGGVAIHTEAVGAGAHYIRVPGVDDGVSTADPRNIDARLNQAASIPGASAPSAADTKANAFANRLVQAFTRQTLAPYQAAVQQAFAGMDVRDVAASLGQFQSVLPILDKRAQATGGPGGGPTITDPERAAASNAALQQGLGYLALDAKIRTDIRTNNGQLLADTEKLNGIIGGPMAANLARQYSIMNDQARIADRIVQLTQRKTQMEAAHAQILQDRQDADTLASRAQTRQQWADQAQDRALAHRRTAEDDAWTVESRRFEDRQRALDFYGTTRQRQLQDELLALDKAHQAAANATTAGNQILSARAFGGDVSAQMRLAIGRQSTKAADDAYTQQKQAINDAIVAEQKLASQQRFDLETERIAAQRNHEDILRGLDRESTANSESRAARDQAHQLDLWQIEDSRAAEDRRYTGAITAIDNEITAQQNLATQADAALKTAQDALSVWQQTGVEVAGVGANLGAAYNAAVAGLSTATGVPYTQFPQPGASRSSDARTAPAAPTPAPAAPSSSSNGDTYQITLMASGNTATDEELLGKLKQWVEARDRRQASGAAGRPMGNIR